MITKSDRIFLNAYLDRTQKAYLSFMGLNEMPAIVRNPVEITLQGANAKGYGTWASVFYDVGTDKFRLDVWKDIYKPQLHADYILFHEYTHAVDIERLAKKDTVRYASIKGYIEYHAAQVELMKQIGAKNIQDNLLFSMNDVVKGVANDKPVVDVLRTGKKAATDLILRPGFPTNIEMLATTMGMVFNHLGRVSICKMFAADYDKYQSELENYDSEEAFFGADAWKLIKALMQGFMLDDEIEMEMKVHFGILMTVSKRYGLA